MNLRGKAAGVVLAVLVLGGKVAAEELPYAVWQHMPVDTPVVPVIVDTSVPPPPEDPPEEGGFQVTSQGGGQSAEAEIVALAAALGEGSAGAGEGAQAKAVRVFNWVRNNIDYEYYYGLRKGAVLTLLEGSGNDFDQCALLADLLVAAGYPASDVKLLVRAYRMDYSKLAPWMGVADQPYPGASFQQATGWPITNWFPPGTTDEVAKQAWHGVEFISQRSGSGSGVSVTAQDLPGKANLFFRRMFVQLTFGGVTYDLDPSYKTYEKIVSSGGLAAAAGYDRATLLTAAGGSGNTNSTSGLNQTNIATQLEARTTQLLGVLNSTWSGATIDEIVNGRRIIRSDATNLAEASAVETNYFGPAATFTSTTDPNLDPYKSKVVFKSPEAVGLDYTNATSDLKGRKLTLTFETNNAVLRLDDDTVADTGAMGAATNMNLTISVTHPGLGTFTPPAATYKKATSAGAPCSYAIIYGFNASERLLAKRQEQLKAYKDAGLQDDSAKVRTELLNIMGLTWLRQSAACARLLAAQNNVLPLSHHRFGRMGQEAGFYVDVGVQLSGHFTDNASPGSTNSLASARYDNVFHGSSLFASALEHGVIEQMQAGMSAVSTVSLLRLANGTAGNALYRANSTNWTTVRPILVAGGYSSTTMTGFDTLISQGNQLFLPKNANISQGIWTNGSGWVIRSSTNAGMIINGGYSGGYATSAGNVASLPIARSFSFNPAAITQSPAMPVANNYTPAANMPAFHAADPVDMATGAFVFAAEDMSVGLEPAPRGLAFSRQYSSLLSTRDEHNMGYGWTHNLHIRAEARTASDEALGLGSPQQAAAFLVAMTAAQDLYRSNATPKEWGVAALVTAWLVDQMRSNAVSVRMGKDIFQFIKQPNGTYTPPAGSTMTLSTTTNSTYRLQQRLGNTINFDAAGKATNIVDVDGRAMTFAYNASTNLGSVQDHVGRTFTFGYDGNKRITSIADSTTPTRSVSFGYDTNGNLITATDPEGKTSLFDYAVTGDPGNTPASDHRIVRLRNPDSETITQNVYDSLGRVERQFLHGDTSKAFRLYYTGRDNYEVNPQGGVTHYYYDERGRPSGSRDAEGNVTSLTYDGQDRVVSRASGAGETTGYSYDAYHNLARIDHPRGGGATVMAYDGLNRLDLVTDPNGVQTDYIYFSSGNDAGKDRPWKIVAASGTADAATTTYSRMATGPAIGRVASVVDGDNLTTGKTYDSNGHPDSTSAPGGFATDYTYDARGNLTAITDPNNKTTGFSYNKRRQVTSAVADSGGIAATTDSAYDNQARATNVIAPAHNGGQRTQVTTTYSPTDKVRVEKLNGVTVAETSYDSRDWTATSKDAANRTTTFVRKANGDLQEAQRPGSRTTTFSYDGDHRLTQTINPGANSGARAEAFAYGTNSSGLPRTVKTEADNVNVTREFDARGQLRFLTDRRGNTFEFRYDALGRRTYVIPPGIAPFTTAYTKNGRVASVSEPSGDTAAFSYNTTSGRLESVAYSGGATVNYTSYDSNGNLLALNENGSNAITRTYDSLNRVTSYAEGGSVIGYRYYPNGKLAKLIYPGGSENGVGHVEYLYNADGRLAQVIDRLDSTSNPRVTTCTWNSDGRLQSVSRPNGTVRTITYDSAGRPETINETAGATSLLSFGLSYYPSDEIKTLDVISAPPLRKTKAVPAVAMTFDAANRVATFGGQAVSHDDDGNMTSGPLPATGAMATYAYDSRNRLNSAGGLTYTYNAEGNRVGIGGGETTSLVVDANSALPKVLVRTKNGVTTRYVYGVGLQYEVSSAGAATYYHYDQTGNTAMLTDAAGAVVDRITYSPYGAIRYRMAEHDTPFLYGGFFGVMTDANGLVAMRARYYNPLTKRFLTSDPALDGLNWYGYAGGNPVSNADPEGRFVHVVIGAGVGGLAGIGGQIVSDAISGELSGINQYAGSFVGGAVTGGIITATGGTSLVAMAIAGGVGAGVGNVTTQSLSDKPFNGTELAVSTTIGTATALIPSPVLKVPGLNSGNGSWAHVADTQMAKLAAGTTASVAPTTLGKIVGANLYRETTAMFYDGVSDAGYSRWIQPNHYSPIAAGGGANAPLRISGGSRK